MIEKCPQIEKTISQSPFKIMLFLRSLLFYIGMVLATFVFSFIALFLLPLPLQQRYKIMKGWAYFILWWLKKTCNLTYQVEGIENIPKSASLILSQHQSAWETIAFQKIFPIQIWILKREILKIPFFGWAIAILKPITIDRKNIRQSMQRIIEQGKQRLAEGLWIVIYPEGTRLMPGEKKRYGIGGAMLAEKSGYPVVPVALNSGEFWPSSSFIKRPGTIKVIIGPVIDSHNKNYKQINALVEKWINDVNDTN